MAALLPHTSRSHRCLPAPAAGACRPRESPPPRGPLRIQLSERLSTSYSHGLASMRPPSAHAWLLLRCSLLASLYPASLPSPCRRTSQWGPPLSDLRVVDAGHTTTHRSPSSATEATAGTPCAHRLPQSARLATRGSLSQKLPRECLALAAKLPREPLALTARRAPRVLRLAVAEAAAGTPRARRAPRVSRLALATSDFWVDEGVGLEQMDGRCSWAGGMDV
jgi:hypothetical protein